ncbi:hypothetical protein [Bartonella tamiae]|uniref:Glycosyl transferase family 28 C-terminal domain-containing protein n=1 Tax=Bartonella tamiae Th239 TaxID=1094558 RepID=J1JVN2_9HYPH|nr:hypothetical protein [Bartonella tamiae]EJF89017.1 hypothetical protein ME5_01568 [Bartonella tamiae Th239]EJF94733.1 hypothetical protein MEG_00314 [Bartonella tamiae Th307]
MVQIGIYVHHHGEGHLSRAMKIARSAPHHFTLLGTGLNGKTETLKTIDLPDDKQTNHETVISHPALHYTPLYHEGIRERNHLITKWMKEVQPALMLIDISVEIAMLSCLNATPFIYTRLSGNRTDVAHNFIFKAAQRVLCPFHPLLESPQTPKWLREKSDYFSSLTSKIKSYPSDDKRILLVLGKGGHNIKSDLLFLMAQELSDWTIDVIGPFQNQITLPKNINIHGWVNNVHSFMARATIVAGACGDGLLSDVMAMNKLFIALPQKRPFDEQVEKARLLHKNSFAVSYEKWPSSWRKAIKKAQNLRHSFSDLHDNNGIESAANYLISMAQRTAKKYKSQLVIDTPIEL